MQAILYFRSFLSVNNLSFLSVNKIFSVQVAKSALISPLSIVLLIYFTFHYIDNIIMYDTCTSGEIFQVIHVKIQNLNFKVSTTQFTKSRTPIQIKRCYFCPIIYIFFFSFFFFNLNQFGSDQGIACQSKPVSQFGPLPTKNLNEATWRCREPSCLCLEPLFDLDTRDLWLRGNM